MRGSKTPGKAGRRATEKPGPKNPAAATASDKAQIAAEAAKRLAKLTPEEQAAALFKTMTGAGGKRSR
jgi:hypothetical protein